MSESENDKDDKIKVDQILIDAMDINPESNGIVSVKRLGKKEVNKPRLICITFNEMYKKRHVLRNAKNLRDAGEAYNKIFIRPDLTPKQLADSKCLKEQLLAVRQQYPTRKFMIKMGSIVQLDVQ